MCRGFAPGVADNHSITRAAAPEARQGHIGSCHLAIRRSQVVVRNGATSGTRFRRDGPKVIRGMQDRRSVPHVWTGARQLSVDPWQSFDLSLRSPVLLVFGEMSRTDALTGASSRR